MARQKGVGFINVRSFVVDHHGGAAWSGVLEALDATDRDTLVSIVGAGWYDLELFARLLRIVDARCGDGDLKLVAPMGRYSAEKDLTTIQRFFLKFTRPSFIIEQTARYWSRFHDTGRWTMTKNGDREIVGVLEDWGAVDAVLCRELLGYLTRTLEMLGGRDVNMVHHKCRSRGERVCEFRARWRLKKDGPLPAESTASRPISGEIPTTTGAGSAAARDPDSPAERPRRTKA